MFFKNKQEKSSISFDTVRPYGRGWSAEWWEEIMNPGSGNAAACVATDVGRIRSNNEDNFLLDGLINACAEERVCRVLAEPVGSEWRFFGVFDGMGGGEKGEEASRIAAELFGQAALVLKKDSTRGLVDERMRRAFLDTNNRIVLLQQEYRIYGTTGTVLCTDGKAFKIYHLGDSRAYLLRDGELFRLTRDQTLAQMKIEVGIYEEDDPQAQIEKHKLTEYIGRDWTRENLRPVESEWIDIQPGDRVLLCSDGLYDMCQDSQVAEVMKEAPSVEAAARELVQLALEGGGEDNVTCMVIWF